MRSFEGRLTHSIVQSLYVPRSWGVEIPAALTTPALVLLGIAGNSRIAQLPPHGRDGPKTLKWSNRPYCRQAIAFATCYRPKNGTHSSCHESDYSRTLWSPHLDRPPEALAWPRTGDSHLRAAESVGPRSVRTRTGEVMLVGVVEIGASDPLCVHHSPHTQLILRVLRASVQGACRRPAPNSRKAPKAPRHRTAA